MLSRKKIFIGVALLTLIYGLWLRVTNLERPLIYDEIWGLMNWIVKPVSEILTLFNNQNNHPLNSVFMKLSNFLFGRSLIMMRMHSFIAGLLIPLFAGAIAWRLTKKRFIVAITIILCSMHAGLIYYSHVARGYSIQTSAVMLFILMVLNYHYNSKKSDKWVMYKVAVMVATFIVACFSLSTAILYLAPVMMMHVAIILSLAWKDNDKDRSKMLGIVFRANSVLVIGYAVITLFAAWMYLGHYAEFRAAVPAGGGFYINSMADVWSFVAMRGQSLLPWLIWGGAICCFILKKYRFVGLMTLGYLLPAFLAGVFIKVGPPRVYLPLVPAVIIAAAIGSYALTMLYEKWSRLLQIILPLALVMWLTHVLPGRYLQWAAIDWSNIISEVNSKFPEYKSYRCYSPNESLPVSALSKNEVNNNIKPIYDGMLLINFGRDRIIKGLNNKNGVGEVEFHGMVNPPSFTITNVTANIYQFKKVVKGSSIKSNIIFAEIPLQNIKTARAAIGYLRTKGREWYLLNCWFNPIRSSNTGEKLLAYQIITNSNNFKVDDLLEIEQKSFGRVKFFWLSGQVNAYGVVK